MLPDEFTLTESPEAKLVPTNCTTKFIPGAPASGYVMLKPKPAGWSLAIIHILASVKFPILNGPAK